MFVQLDSQGSPQEWPLTDMAAIALHKDTSFPLPLSPDGHPELGLYKLKETIVPETTRYQAVEEVMPVLVDGQWTQQWNIIEFSEEEKKATTAAKSRTAREDRNMRLADCDWTQLPDAPVDHAEWAAYRQALRDVTSQPGFPWEVVWPEQPSN